MSAPLFACCYIPELPVQALLRMRPALRGHAVAVLQGESPLERVCSQNPAAARFGIVHGMPRTQLDTFHEVAALRRSLPEEMSAMTALFQSMGMFSPRIEDQSRDGVGTLIADIAGTERLLGAPAAVVQKIIRHAESLGLRATVAASSNVHTALCLARFGRSLVVEPGREQEALAAVPVTVAEPMPQHAETLAHWGIRTFGELAVFQEQGLITRFGQHGKRLRQLARGEYPHLFQPAEPEPALEEFIEFEEPVDVLDSLLFVVHPMLDQLLLRARTHAQAIAKLDLLLTLDGSAEHRRTVRPAVPSEDKLSLLKLLQLDLQTHPPPAAVKKLQLTAEIAATKKVQLGLFAPPLPEASRLDVTLARLRAIVGEDRVGSPMLDDTHRSDAFHLEPFRSEPGSKPADERASATAMRQLRPPEPVTVLQQHGNPKSLRFRGESYRVTRAYGPWQSSGAWWSSALWVVEQWDVLAKAENTAAMLACCLVYDCAHGGWQVDALYD